ncbi:prominin-like protein isoform X7 [Schistocerca gregaria]|uniref:prominin-like protein isoform X7 n=1 Tax=Schistocerca gregaria TaxID=7010 RepID=UPI00211DE4E8|nr:prominin-like protein isoform X7 [Schistocerca gregaria]
MVWCGAVTETGSAMSFTMTLPTALIIAMATLGCAPSAGGTTNLTGYFDSLSFSEAKTSNNYNSSSSFNPLGMGHLYYVTNYFIDLVVKKDLLPEGSKKHIESLLRSAVGPPRANAIIRFDSRYIEEDQFYLDWAHLQPLLSFHAGTLAVVSVGLLFALVMPLAGLILCCCRCCRSSRRPRTEKHRDGCRRLLYGTLLAAVATIILFGVVCAFVTNAYMENGIKALPRKLNTALDDSQLYFTNTKLEVSTLLVTNYEELQETVSKALSSCGKLLASELAEESQAVVLSNLTLLVADLPVVQAELKKTQELTKSLQSSAVQLQRELSKIRADLEGMLRNCSSKPACQTAIASQNIQNLNTTADFTNLLDRYFPKLPDMNESLDAVEELLADGIIENVKKGANSFEQMMKDINESVNKSKPDIENTMKDAGVAIQDKADKISKMVEKLNDEINDSVRKPITNNLQKGIDDYSRYRYYIDISVSSVVLVVLLCMTLGLFYGFCGKRPDAMFNEDCCNKGTGASFLKLAVWVMFLFSTVLMLVTLAHFVVGVVLQRAGCDTLQNPEDSQVFALIDKHVDVASIFPSNSSNITLSSIVTSCHMNESLFGVLRVLDAVNIAEIKNFSEKYRIEEKIRALEDSIKIGDDVNFVILDEDTRKDLESLKNSPLNYINFTAFSSVLGAQIVAANVTKLAKTLNDTADDLSRNPGNDIQKVQESLRKHSAQLVILQTTTIDPMTAQVNYLIATTTSLQEHLKFNHNSLSDAIDSLLKEIDEAQIYLETNATQKIQELTESLINEFVTYIKSYETHVVQFTVNDLGRCGPVSKAYNATVVATCDEILKPFNGFWASIGWCLLLFIPAIVISLKLTGLYHKLDPYQGPLAESEYLYDAYADRDNIPLANGPDKKNHHRRYNETYDNSSGYMGDYNTHLGRGDRSRDRTSAGYSPEDLRFTDMAPKHWDFSNGGVPRYHSPPLSTEYERPPPYYYPGPGDSSRS